MLRYIKSNICPKKTNYSIDNSLVDSTLYIAYLRKSCRYNQLLTPPGRGIRGGSDRHPVIESDR